jgi:conjugative relaxase-like TrwC/TraI family protein
MTVHKLSAGDGYTYLTRQVAAGDHARRAGENLAGYYTATGNPPGRWLGSGCRELGVSGTVSEAQMLALFGQGRHPDTDRILLLERATGATEQQAMAATRLGVPFRHQTDAAGRRPVAGYDLVFTPVKSVSLLWALGDPTVRDAVLESHHAAVADTLGWLEEHAAFTRTGKGGIAQVDTRGLTAAGFDHYDSRLGDPDLHTHVAVSNKVATRQPGPDGRPRWLALDGRALYHAGVAASERYNTRLEAGVAARLGVVFTERPDTPGRDGRRPVREVAGIPLHLISGFSGRRGQVEHRYGELAAGYRAEHGRDPDRGARIRLAQQATLETRRAKQPPRALADQLAAWRTRAARLLAGTTSGDGDSDTSGVAVDELIASVIGHRVEPTVVTGGLLAAAADLVVETVQAERATWTRWNLVAEVERVTRGWRFPSSTDRDRVVEELLGLVTDPARVIRIQAPALVEEPEVLRRADGDPVFTPHAAERYTSPATLHAEQAILDAADQAATTGAPPDLVQQVLDVVQDGGPRLDPGQRRLVESFAGSDRRLVAGIGPAGSGKTTAMRAACAVWDADARRVIPLASSAKAADVLARELGRRAENLHKYLHELHQPPGAGGDRDDFFRLRAGDVLLVDEAGMAGTHQLHTLLTHATAAGAVLRLVGDPQQLAAVEAGGVLRLLAQRPDTVQLAALHRFTDPAEVQATLALRNGDPAALEFYEQNDRVVAGAQETMVDAAFTGWRTDMAAGKASVLGAVSTQMATDLAARARRDRVAVGAVDPDGVKLADDTLAGVGDWVTTRRNNRLLQTNGGRDFVKNGDTWTVAHRFADGALSVVHRRHGGRVTLPAGYVAQFLELGYAVTAYRVQGDTVDTAHPVITEQTSREALYVLATRARDRTTLYVATDPPVDVATEHAPPEPRTARDVLEQVLANQTAELSATETIAATLAGETNLATQTARYGHAADTAHAQPGAVDWAGHLRDRARLIRDLAEARHRPPDPPAPVPAPLPARPPAPPRWQRPGPRLRR